ncbi:uncharacterized protein LOC115602406 [Strigops habroptila]|uniref:uncharacterized protein LOC115602406 n=1 Tax=Strigops habroptila TaxID=2489341 RepID=UPI0011CF1CF8|nr:uncharacterized protein LOC115602406 [Strigops habroptila]
MSAPASGANSLMRALLHPNADRVLQSYSHRLVWGEGTLKLSQFQPLGAQWPWARCCRHHKAVAVAVETPIVTGAPPVSVGYLRSESPAGTSAEETPPSGGCISPGCPAHPGVRGHGTRHRRQREMTTAPRNTSYRWRRQQQLLWWFPSWCLGAGDACGRTSVERGGWRSCSSGALGVPKNTSSDFTRVAALDSVCEFLWLSRQPSAPAALNPGISLHFLWGEQGPVGTGQGGTALT